MISDKKGRQESSEAEMVSENVSPFRAYLPSKVYDALKWLDLVVFPAISTLLYILAYTHELEYVYEIVGVLVVTDFVIGVAILISTINYNRSDADIDGDMIVDTSHPEKDVYRMALNEDIDSLTTKRRVTFKVLNTTAK